MEVGMVTDEMKVGKVMRKMKLRIEVREKWKRH